MIVECDESQIKQVFVNLVKNAIDAMSTGGELRMETLREGDCAVIRFTDQGSGIPSDKLDCLGKPFYTTKEKGTGLGLMVSYNIIENNHQGKIAVTSKAGVGTTFQVSLPLSCEDIAGRLQESTAFRFTVPVQR